MLLKNTHWTFASGKEISFMKLKEEITEDTWNMLNTEHRNKPNNKGKKYFSISDNFGVLNVNCET